MWALMNVSGERVEGEPRRYGVVVSLHASEREAFAAFEARGGRGYDFGRLDIPNGHTPLIGERLPFWGTP